MKKNIGLLLIVMFSMFSLTACFGGGGNICDDYCDQEEKCFEQADQMFSKSKCDRTCTENKESYDSIGCEDEIHRYLECLVDLSCNDWNEQGRMCSTEVDSLNQCIEKRT